MTKEFEKLKKELAQAGSENDVLAALDGYSGELTDEEVMSIFGGVNSPEDPVDLTEETGTTGETGNPTGETGNPTEEHWFLNWTAE